MRIIGVIPARFGSSRFPGKPLADICGHPMIWWVYNNVKDIPEFDELVVATDDERIKEKCKEDNINVVLTSSKHESGTDRVVEVSEKITGDLFIVVMGDEPLIQANDVGRLIDEMIGNDCIAGMLITKYKSPVDVVNTTTIKVAINDNNDVIFMSRVPIPFPKAMIGYDYYKNIGVYAFRKEALEIFKSTPKGRIEKAEDLEMLRLIEKHCIVRAVEVNSDSMSVDTQKDLERIRAYVSERMN